MNKRSRTRQERKPAAPAPSSRTMLAIARAAVILALVVFAVFYLMLAMGAASFIDGCDTVLCGQLHQAVFAAVAALAVLVAAYRMLTGQSLAAEIVFVGTVPILVVHIILVVSDPNESIFFPLSTTPPPAISGALLAYGGLDRARRRRVPAE